jgi:FkbM family methyltransferase
MLDVSRSDAQRVLYLEGERFIEERFLLRRLVQGRKRIVDVGANIGYYLLMLARFSGPDAAITCIEPSGDNLLELDANMQVNRLRNVRLHRVAAGESRARVELTSGINACVIRGGAGDGSTMVDLVPLDELVPEGADFVKIDVEGYENRVLYGARALIERCRPVLFVELHPRRLRQYGSSVLECVRLLEEYYDDVAFWGGSGSCGLCPLPAGSFPQRLAALYMGRDCLGRLALDDGLIRRIDDASPLGTFWAVARSRKVRAADQSH